MKRVLVAAIGAAALLLTAVPAAKADFHFKSQACKTEVGSAHIGLTESAGTFTFFGDVTCNGATSANITSLKLIPLVLPGAQVDGGTAGCAPCDATPIATSGTAPSAPGLYEVKMNFNACCSPTGGTYRPIRRAQYLFANGTLTKTCGPGAAACI